MSYLVDTNILGRIAQKTHPMHLDAVRAVRKLRRRQEELCILPQNLVELWVVATRPAASNGFGMTTYEATKEMRRFKRLFQLYPDAPTIFRHWERLVKKHRVSGKPAHDARLVAAMQAHGITHLLTFNTDDFKRYAGIITVVAP
jgi:predicted nucleic acid-binding protein